MQHRITGKSGEQGTVSYPYKVTLHGIMPALAWIWLRNNQVSHEITYGFDYDSDERLLGAKIVVAFQDAKQAHWFSLKYGGRG